MTTQAHEFNIEMATVPRELVKDVLRALLHSIFFHRLLVNVAPQEQMLLGTTVALTDSKEVDRLIEERAAEFLQRTYPHHVKQGKIALLFYEKRPKKNWFSKSEELVCWERWAITLSLTHPLTERDRVRTRQSVEKQLSQCLLDVLKMANDYKEHIPSITTTEGNPFPYQIAVPSQSESWAAMIKRLLVTDAPPVKEKHRPGTRREPISSVPSASSLSGMDRFLPTQSASSSSSTSTTSHANYNTA